MFVFRLVDTLVAKADVRVHYQRADRSIILNASTGQPYARVVPDILVERRADATIRIAIDAKYKLYDERRLSSGDVYQSFLYAYAYGDTSGQTLPTALVVYLSSVGGTKSSTSNPKRANLGSGRNPGADKVSRMLGRTVNPTVYSNAEFSKRTKTDNAFVNRVLEGPKVWVIGVGDSVLVNA